MFTMRHFQCGNGPFVLGSMGHFKFEGANPASRRPRNIPVNTKLFPVHRPGGLKRTDWDFFPHDFKKKSIFTVHSSQ